jgi:uncharacterized metal-binding protein YceD (DUF177 family)
MTRSEFSRPVRLDAIGQAPNDMRFAADPNERAALATRFALAELESLEVEAAVRREGTTIYAEGRIRATVVQTCVATGEPLPVSIDEPFTLRFVPEAEAADAEEIELTDADCDTLTYAGGAVDMGEAAAETLLLALDPFPRCSDADETLRKAGVVSEEEAAIVAEADAPANPFAALQALKDKLTDKG